MSTESQPDGGGHDGAVRTVVHLVRHGLVENPHGVLYGRLPDYHLSAIGREMAATTAAYLSGRDVTHLRCSPLERAQESMEPIAAIYPLPVTIDGRVIEAQNHLEGQQVSLGGPALRDPKNWWLFRNPLKPSWGEPYTEIVARMRLAMQDAAAAAAGHEAVVVSHQLPIWMARCDAEGRRLAARPAQTRVRPVQRHLLHPDRRPGHLGRLRLAGRRPDPGRQDQEVRRGRLTMVRRLSRRTDAPPASAATGQLSRRVGAAALAGVLLLAAGCSSTDRSTDGGYVGTTASSVTLVPPDQRKAIPTVSGDRLGGQGTLSTADYAGKVVVINVWGSWCPPCREEAPALEAASEKTAGTAAFVGITTKDSDPAPAEAFVRSFGITYPSIFDPTGNVLLSFAGTVPPSAIPSTLVLDQQGRIAVRVLGTVSTDTLVDMVHDVAAGK